MNDMLYVKEKSNKFIRIFTRIRMCFFKNLNVFSKGVEFDPFNIIIKQSPSFIRCIDNRLPDGTGAAAQIFARRGE